MPSKIDLQFKVCHTYEDTQTKLPEGVVKIHPLQAEFIKREDKFLLAFIAGQGSGKTVAGVLKVLRMMSKYPRLLGFIGSPTLDQQNLSVLVELKKCLMAAGLRDKEDFVYGKEPPKPWNVKSKFMRDHANILTLRNGAQCRIYSLQNWEMLDGASYGYAYVDEICKCPEDGVKLVISRLRGGDIVYPGYKHQFWTTSYVNGRGDYLWQLFCEESPDRHPDSAYINCPTSANVFLTRAYTDNLASIYSESERLEKIAGLWNNKIPGRVFPTFERLKHVIA